MLKMRFWTYKIPQEFK